MSVASEYIKSLASHKSFVAAMQLRTQLIIDEALKAFDLWEDYQFDNQEWSWLLDDYSDRYGLIRNEEVRIESEIPMLLFSDRHSKYNIPLHLYECESSEVSAKIEELACKKNSSSDTAARKKAENLVKIKVALSKLNDEERALLKLTDLLGV